MSYTSQYAQSEMSKAVSSNKKPKIKTKSKTRGGKSVTIKKTNSPTKKTKEVIVNGTSMKGKVVLKKTKDRKREKFKYTTSKKK